tara:strand:- start:1763 stop:2287 length:525 start_codon:yes stop_codon:yes gene_type:complete
MKKTTISIVWILLCFFIKPSFGQEVTFDYSNSNSVNYALADIDNITFTGDILNLDLNDGTIISRNINTIEKFQYSNVNVGITDMLGIIEEISLKLYPNPNEGEFQISYSLLSAENIQINILSQNGTLVKEVFNGENEIGDYNLNINLDDLASGVYICQFYIGQSSISKQVILTK